jgi:hypothetical protein
MIGLTPWVVPLKLHAAWRANKERYVSKRKLFVVRLLRAPGKGYREVLGSPGNQLPEKYNYGEIVSR